ncbi:hypothetical protein SARC_05484 [Sphaeroforma arctica JP610]|uniref:Uncharacterized protein n=1 Tax=Sphaeroforma arctica JP610 TaxID=667725 RepID=A0A0L0FZF9_9EUKA|nr:hypothetical protein SARC_05484 [Sphaeroforma arctica JP610]KNC82217.1 hypothetical protein SARC_05484 [Sphaeroforma arctica JP610]|eukprot:XP_014156119.1 hypothetical protein SARC_05484 [Sphaeroforma arctica JP610]
MEKRDTPKGWKRYVKRRPSWRDNKPKAVNGTPNTSTSALEIEDCHLSIDGDDSSNPREDGLKCEDAPRSPILNAQTERVKRNASITSRGVSDIGISITTSEEKDSQLSVSDQGHTMSDNIHESDGERRSCKKKQLSTISKDSKRRSAKPHPHQTMCLTEGPPDKNLAGYNLIEKEKGSRKRSTVFDKLMMRKGPDSASSPGTSSYAEGTFEELLPKLLRRADVTGTDGSMNQAREFMRDTLYSIQDHVFSLSIEDDAEMRTWGREKIAPEQVIYQLKDWDRRLRALDAAVHAYDQIRANSEDTLSCDDCMARTLEVKYLKDLLQTTFDDRDELDRMKEHQASRLRSQEDQITQLRAQLAKANFDLKQLRPSSTKTDTTQKPCSSEQAGDMHSSDVVLTAAGHV